VRHAHLHAEKEISAGEDATLGIPHHEMLVGMARKREHGERRRIEPAKRHGERMRRAPHEPAIETDWFRTPQRRLARRVHQHRHSERGELGGISRVILMAVRDDRSARCDLPHGGQQLVACARRTGVDQHAAHDVCAHFVASELSLPRAHVQPQYLRLDGLHAQAHDRPPRIASAARSR